MLELRDVSREDCIDELVEYESWFDCSSNWRYRLTEKALLDTFAELKAQNVSMLTMAGVLDRPTTFRFTPHIAKDNVAFYYSVACPTQGRQEKSAKCTIIINQAFYSDIPSDYFYIEERSDIDTALWAYSVHRGVEGITEHDGVEELLKDSKGMPTIEINDKQAKFLYSSGGCSYSLLYRIIGDNEVLEFISMGDRFCI